MAILTIKSENPDLSWVLSKHPETLLKRKLRRGEVYGLFEKEDTYSLVFKDAPGEDSFAIDETHALTKNEFASPAFYYHAIQNCLRSAIQGTNDKDVNFPASVTMHAVGTFRVKAIDHLIRHFADLKLESTEIATNTFKLVISGDTTIQKLLSATTILTRILGGRESIKGTVEENLLIRTAGMLNELELGYYIRYMFMRDFVLSPTRFEVLGGLLDTDTIKLTYGSAAEHRMRYVDEVLDTSYPILDVGCGEANFLHRWFHKNRNHTYYGVDVDEEIIENNIAKAKVRKMDAEFYTDLAEFEYNGAVNIILSEVLEHMSPEESMELLTKVLKLNFNKLCITMPNRTFNHNYGLEEGEMRDEDHDYEPNKEEFEKLICDAVMATAEEEGKLIEFSPVGDTVDGVSSHLGCTITRTVKPTAIITVGCSASGKSSFARSITRDNDDWTEINRDNVRFNGKPKDWASYAFTDKNEGRVTGICNGMISRAAAEGKNIIISDTNLNAFRRGLLMDKLIELGFEVVIRLFDVPFGDLVERHTKMPSAVPMDRLHDQYRRFVCQFKGVVPYTIEEDATVGYICDLDGTLVDITGRDPYSTKHYHLDKPIAHVVKFVKALITSGAEVHFVSGRSEYGRQGTLEQLENVLGIAIHTKDLSLRAREDRRPDPVVKMEIFNNTLRQHRYAWTAIDDRLSVIEECWSPMNIPVISVGKVHNRF